MIGDGFTRFANPVSVSLVKQAVSLKPKLEPVSVSTKSRRQFVAINNHVFMFSRLVEEWLMKNCQLKVGQLYRMFLTVCECKNRTDSD